MGGSSERLIASPKGTQSYWHSEESPSPPPAGEFIFAPRACGTMERGFASSWLFLEPSQNRKGKPCPDFSHGHLLNIPHIPPPQRTLGSMAVKTGRKAMDPNVRWDRREERKRRSIISSYARKADWPPGVSPPRREGLRPVRQTKETQHLPLLRYG